MNGLSVLILRNLRLFLRDKATVFFSFLSTLIIIALYFLFIARVYREAMDEMASGGIAAMLDSSAKYFIVYLQMMAGVLVLNSMSLSTGVFSTIAKDFETKRIDSFLLTPIKPYEMILSYFICAMIVSFGMNAFTWLVSYIIIGLTTGYWLALQTFFMALLVLFITSLVSCSIMLFITSLVKSSSAIGVVNGVSGTFFGFLCGIYMPYSNLGETTKIIGSALPFTHLTIWLKQVMLNSAFGQLGINAEFGEILLNSHFSAASIGFLNFSVPLWVMVCLSTLFGLACLVISYSLLNKRLKTL